MKIAKTKTLLAQELGVARSTLHRWEQIDGFPKRTAKGWDIAACKAFVELQGLNAPPVLAEEKRRLTKAQADLAELKLKQQEEILVSKEQVKEHTAIIIGKLVGIMKTTLSRQDFNAVSRQFQQVNCEL